MSSFKSDLVSFIQEIYGTNDFIPLHQPLFDGNEKQYLLDVIDSTFVSSVGEYVDKFESMICEYTGSNYAIATSNGTSALHIALLMSGVEENDEVITQSLTFVATCNAISYCNAQPVFIDIDKCTMGMSPKSLEEFLSSHAEIRNNQCWNKSTKKRIKACIPMHSFGHPVKIDEIVSICKKYHIALIEDAAESLGSKYKDKHTGTFSDFGILSFNGNKIITTGGGGMILTDNKTQAEKAKHLTTTAKTKHPWLFIHDQIAFNYRLPNINAALGCAQLEQIESFVKTKRDLARKYDEWFSNTNYQFVNEPDSCESNYWFNSFLASDRQERDEILEYTNSKNVMTRPSWTPMHELDMFSDCQKDNLENTIWIEDRLINIPSSVKI